MVKKAFKNVLNQAEPRLGARVEQLVAMDT